MIKPLLLSLGDVKSHLLNGLPILDVRAPVEFQAGSLPGSINIPILDDDERTQVGTTYKQSGQAAAITLAQRLVSGKVKDLRIAAWKEFKDKHPQGILTCFRGGLRSRTAAEWLRSEGVEISIIEGGYKKIRQFLIDQINLFSSCKDLLVVAGPTGSGKSLLLQELSSRYELCDLERYASHRGSAFGNLSNTPQPTQIDFENKLALSLLRTYQSPGRGPVLIEDESRMIGNLILPSSLFEAVRIAPMIIIEEDLKSRVDTIFKEYILDSPITSYSAEGAGVTFSRFEGSLGRISKKLGAVRYQELKEDILRSKSEYFLSGDLETNKIWIEKLLRWYYDPMYQRDLAHRKSNILYQGSRAEVLQFLTEEKSKKTA